MKGRWEESKEEIRITTAVTYGWLTACQASRARHPVPRTVPRAHDLI